MSIFGFIGDVTGFVERLYDEIKEKLYPTGDPEAIRVAAQAWTALASSIEGMLQNLTPVADGLEKTWHGVESSYDKSAGEQFQAAWKALGKEMGQYAQFLQAGAKQLNAIADQIEQTQQQAVRLRDELDVAVAAIVAQAALTWWFLPADAAVGEEAAGEEMLVSAEADTLLESLATALRTFLSSLLDLIEQLFKVAGRFVIGAAVGGWAPEALVKDLQAHSLTAGFNFSDYTEEQVGNIILGGIIGSVLLTGLADVPILKAFNDRGLIGLFSDENGNAVYLSKLPLVGDSWGAGVKSLVGGSAVARFLTGGTVLGTVAFGVTGGAVGSVLSQQWVEDQPVDPVKVAESALVSGLSGLAVGSAQAGVEYAINKTTPGGVSGVVKNGVSVVSGAVSFNINYPPASSAGEPPLTMPGKSSSSFTDPAAAAPPTVTFVKSGDTLLGITNGKWQEIGAIANANEVGDVNQIFPNEELVVPPASSWASHAQLPSLGPANTITVQPGQTLWSIARGDEEKIAEIARLNGLTNPNQIAVGQTLKLPS